MEKQQEILDFWFGSDYVPEEGEPEFRKEWFIKDEAFDRRIEEQFAEDLERAIRGEYDDWAETPRGRLALIILLDQFSRNLFRGSPRSWSQDLLALKLSLEGIDKGHDLELGVVERGFFYLPIEHSEDIHLQNLSVEKFGELLEIAPEIAGGENGLYDYAVRHRDVIEQFGRYPHRNEVLGRPNTPEEEEFLAKPGAGF
jgi:uncharacterized protein (DUF924 family)